MRPPSALPIFYIGFPNQIVLNNKYFNIFDQMNFEVTPFKDLIQANGKKQNIAVVPQYLIIMKSFQIMVHDFSSNRSKYTVLLSILLDNFNSIIACLLQSSIYLMEFCCVSYVVIVLSVIILR